MLLVCWCYLENQAEMDAIKICCITNDKHDWQDRLQIRTEVLLSFLCRLSFSYPTQAELGVILSGDQRLPSANRRARIWNIYTRYPFVCPLPVQLANPEAEIFTTPFVPPCLGLGATNVISTFQTYWYFTSTCPHCVIYWGRKTAWGPFENDGHAVCRDSRRISLAYPVTNYPHSGQSKSPIRLLCGKMERKVSGSELFQQIPTGNLWLILLEMLPQKSLSSVNSLPHFHTVCQINCPLADVFWKLVSLNLIVSLHLPHTRHHYFSNNCLSNTHIKWE